MGAIVLVLLMGLATAAVAAPLVLDPRDGAVLGAPQAKRLLHQCSRASPGGFSGTWTPEPGQIRELELRLPAALMAALQSRERELRKRNVATPQRAAFERRAQFGYQPRVFVRQYAGLALAGQRIIYVNALPKSTVDNPALPPAYREDWQHVADIVCDGGVAFFGVEYQPATKSFAHFVFNGSL